MRHLLAVIVPMEATTPQAKLLIQALAAGLGAVIKAAGPQQAAARAPVTEWVNALEGSPRIHKDALVSIIGAGAVDLPHLDGVISRMISSGSRALPGVELAVLVLTNCILGESSAAVADFGLTIDLLLRVAQRHPQGSLLLQLVEQARARGGQGPQGQAGAAGGAPGQESGGPPQGEAQGQGQGMGTQREQMTALFDQWVRMLHARKGDDKAERVDGENVKFVSQVRAMGFLNGDENTERFLRVLTEVSVIHCLKSETPGTRQLSFVAVDALVKLIAMLVSKHGGGAPLLAKVLSVMASVLQRDAASRGGAFNARPYYRMCIGLIYELTPSNQSDASAFPMLAAMAAAFNALQPLRVPGFAFAWLELVSFRGFLPKLLLLPRNKGWPHLLRLLVALLRFLEPYLHQAQLTPPVRLLYRGTLRVFLVLLHDFPEFLAEYHYQLCNAIPTSCVQFRNLILSAFPRSMRLPDPLTPNLKVDTLPEMALTPQILPDPVQGLPPHIRGLLDEVLAAQGQQKLGQAVHALCEEVKRVTRAEGLAGFTTSHATSLLNAVAFGVCKGALELGKGAQQPLLMSVFLQMATEVRAPQPR